MGRAAQAQVTDARSATFACVDAGPVPSILRYSLSFNDLSDAVGALWYIHLFRPYGYLIRLGIIRHTFLVAYLSSDESVLKYLPI